MPHKTSCKERERIPREGERERGACGRGEEKRRRRSSRGGGGARGGAAHGGGKGEERERERESRGGDKEMEEEAEGNPRGGEMEEAAVGGEAVARRRSGVAGEAEAEKRATGGDEAVMGSGKEILTLVDSVKLGEEANLGKKQPRGENPNPEVEPPSSDLMQQLETDITTLRWIWDGVIAIPGQQKDLSLLMRLLEQLEARQRVLLQHGGEPASRNWPRAATDQEPAQPEPVANRKTEEAEDEETVKYQKLDRAINILIQRPLFVRDWSVGLQSSVSSRPR